MRLFPLANFLALLCAASPVPSTAIAQPAGVLDDAAPTHAPPKADAGSDLPVVKSREDYESLTPYDRSRFNRARRPAVTTFFDPRIDLVAPVEFDGRPGEVSTQRYGFAVGPAFRISDEADFAIRVAAEWSIYNFSGASGLLPGVNAPEPFDDARQFSITPVINSVNPDGWNWVAGVTLETFGESGADFSDTVSFGGIVAASYPITSRLRLGGGITAQHSIARDDIAVIPVPLIDWRITDTLSLRTEQRGVALAYQPRFGWEFALNATFERREFRLDEDGPIPGGAVIDRTFPIHFAVTYKPHPRFNIGARIGSNVWSEMDVYTDGGARISDIERGAALSGGIELRIRF